MSGEWCINNWRRLAVDELETQNSKLEMFYLSNMGEFSMKDAMKQFLNQSKLKGDIQALQIEEVWEKLMGKTISKYTESIKIIHHTLIITTNVAPLKQELVYQKENIIKRVNEALGEGVVKEVIIK